MGSEHPSHTACDRHASERPAPERTAVEALIPHRDPFLFVDRIVERDARAITTEWRVAEDLDCFRGHYPGDPILPGVLITEFALQSGALLLAGDGPPAAGARPVLSRIEAARFRRVVPPGTTLRARVVLEEALANARYLSGTVSAGGRVVARLRFVLALAEAPIPSDGPAQGPAASPTDSIGGGDA